MTAEAVGTVMPCECGSAKGDHQGGTYWCRTPGCDCKRYTPDIQRASKSAAGELPAKWEGADYLKRHAESATARLNRVEQDLAESLAELAYERKSRFEFEEATTEQVEGLRAELASARAELERLRYSGWIVARDGGRHCERCEQEVTRGQAYELQPGTGGLLTHVHCPVGAA